MQGPITLTFEGKQITFAFTGTVLETLINPFSEPPAPGQKKKRVPSVPVPRLVAEIGYGLRCQIQDDNHVGMDRETGNRELRAYGIPRKSRIFNCREFSAISQEDLGAIAAQLELPGPIPHGMLGENLVVQGIPQFTQLPSGSLLHFWDSDTGNKRDTILAVWRENEPCHIPGQLIMEHHYPERADLPEAFQKMRSLDPGIRGVVGFTFMSGPIDPGDVVRVQLP